MKDSANITIDGRSWKLFRNRTLGKGQIYQSEDGQMYLRIGNAKAIHDEIDLANKLYELGFPVPKTEYIGTFKNMAYFIENSLGGETFGVIFRRQFKENGVVSDKTFNEYCHLSKKFLATQLQSAGQFKDRKNHFKAHLHPDSILRENTDFDSELLTGAVDKALARTSKLPSVLTHGDLNPFNILQKGVIDFEHSFIAPAGYDVIGNIFYGRFWNFTDEQGASKLSYDFTNTQIEIYLRIVDDVAEKYGIEKLSNFTDDFLILKALWALRNEKEIAQSSGLYNKWHFRRAVLAYCLKQYSAGKPIDTQTFGSLNHEL